MKTLVIAKNRRTAWNDIEDQGRDGAERVWG